VPEYVPAHDAATIAQAAERAADVWGAGGLVAFPTETVYGLGGAARSPEAVARVFQAKGRPADHPLIVHVAAADQIERWARDVPSAAWCLAEAAWPGPLTLILRRRDDVPAAVTGGQPTVALRVPAHPVALALLRAFGDGVAAPSANRFGRVSPTTAAHVLADLGHVAGLVVVDGGPCDVGIESTIVDLTGSRPIVRRLGAIGHGAIEAALGEAVLGAADAAQVPGPRVPGALQRHYAPATPARSVPAGAGDRAPAHVAVLARRIPPPGRRGGWVVLPDEPRAAGRALYRGMRELDGVGASELWLEAVPDTPAWAAIADRLSRAVAPAPSVATGAPEEGT
jgi:L-threonylcarbamoyladenylate synthase